MLSSALQGDTYDSRPVVYLTFDDGPSADSVTEQILEVLATHDAEATFFVTGQRTRKNPEKIASILYGGHSLGNHTNSHVRLTGVSDEEVLQELRSTNKAVLDAGGPPLTCFRPPFGSTSHRVNRVAGLLGLTSVKWTADTRDWHPDVEASAVYTTLDKSRSESIVLMHDGPIRRWKTAHVFASWMSRNAYRFQFKALPDCQTYGSDVIHASVSEKKVDSIDELLAKLRDYQFNLQRAEIRLEKINHQLTAKLEPALIEQ